MEIDVRQLAEKLSGRFIVFDGPDGCGKTTQRDLLGQALSDAGCNVVKCKDPGGTAIGNRIRHILLDYDLSKMDVRCEAMLFMASRAQLVGELVDPALAEGKVVICDRYVSSTCAYQGAQGYDIKRVIEVAPFAIGDRWPDATIVLDIDVETGFSRTGRQRHHVGKNRKKYAGQQNMFDGAQTDAMEARPVEFHRKVREIFLQLEQFYPSKVVTVDARDEAGVVHANVLEVLSSVKL